MRGRPPKVDSKKKRFEVRLSESQYLDLEDLATKKNTSKTDVIIDGIELVKKEWSDKNV